MVILPRRVKPQPVPGIVEGGDCGACVLGGLFDLSVEEVYEFQEVQPRGFAKMALVRPVT
jgi:hypothetical protein